MKWIIGLAIVALLGVSVGCVRRGTLSSDEAHRLVATGAKLLDVRSPEEFAAGHIEGAVNIAVQELDGRLAELGSKETPVIVYCRSGMRSHRASQLLKSAGFSSVHDLGAMSRW
jgi:phage shock protein E